MPSTLSWATRHAWVKFSIRQILASTAGAVAAAVIASVFGVKGTIVGVAIGSAAATMATAFVAQSIDRGHQAVKQVAIRVPESSSLLRRLGGTGASGDSASSVDASSAPTEVVGQSAPQAGGDADTVGMTSTAAASGAAETERVPSPVTADAPATQRLRAATPPTQRAASRSLTAGFSWRTIAGAAAIVFVLALLLVTAIELISGKPLSDIFGGAGSGTTLNNLVNNPAPTPAPTPTSTTSTTSTVSSTTTTTAGSTSTTTSTTAPTGSATTTTTTPAPSSTTTTAPALGATTTTTASP